MSVRTVAKWLARDRHGAGRSVVAAASAAASTGGRRSKRRSSRCVGPARPPGRSAPRCGVPRSTVTRVLGARRPESGGACSSRRRRCSATSGRTSAICSISTSSGSGRVVGHWPSHPRRSAAPGRRVGWEFLHVAIDDATRLTYAEVLAARRCARVRRVSAAHAARWFRRRGVRIRRLLTDNAMAYRARVFARRLSHRGPSVSASPGRIARRPTARPSASFRRLLREWAYRTPYRSSARRTAALGPISASTTTGVHTRASVDARRGCVSKRLPNEQPL